MLPLHVQLEPHIVPCLRHSGLLPCGLRAAPTLRHEESGIFLQTCPRSFLPDFLGPSLALGSNLTHTDPKALPCAGPGWVRYKGLVCLQKWWPRKRTLMPKAGPATVRLCDL